MSRLISSMLGGDNGGIAAKSVSEIAKIFLPFAWFSVCFPIFLDENTFDSSALEVLRFSIDDKNVSLGRFVSADSITEVKVPDSRSPWIMICEWNNQEVNRFADVYIAINKWKTWLVCHRTLTIGAYMRVKIPFFRSFSFRSSSVHTTCSRYLKQAKDCLIYKLWKT